MSNVIAEGNTGRKQRTVTILLGPELRTQLEHAAADHERSLGGEIRALLKRHLEQPDQPEENT